MEVLFCGTYFLTKIRGKVTQRRIQIGEEVEDSKEKGPCEMM